MSINETHYLITPYLHIRFKPRAFTFIDQKHRIKQSDFSSEQLNIACLSALVTFAIFYVSAMKLLIKIYYSIISFVYLLRVIDTMIEISLKYDEHDKGNFCIHSYSVAFYV